MVNQFFPPRPPATPTIYAFASTHPDHAGLLKVGYTERIAADRIAEQFPSGMNAYRIELIEPAMRPDGSSFSDRDVHRHLRARGIKNTSHEWFKCKVAQVRAAVVAVRERTANIEDRTLTFAMRPEQREAVEMTADYFRRARKEQRGHTPHFLQRTAGGAIKPRNEWVHDTQWDCVMLDEYHYGAWRENAKGLFGADEADEGEVEAEITKDERAFDESILPITTGHYLYLSGTPFRALASGEFIEEQIYNWTYSDEQRAKRDWAGPGVNPYLSLPRLVLMTYTLPDDIRQVAEEGEFNEFDLNEFFRAEGEGEDARFEHADEVQKWLDLIRGAYRGTTVDDLKLGKDRPPLPFSDARLLGVLQHSFWFLPSVASCNAMASLLKARQNTFYHDYNVVIAAGSRAGIGAAALPPVLEVMDEPLSSKSITLSCGKLTTGVTV